MAIKNTKRNKAKGKLSRKEQRKENRKQKKVRRNEYYTNRKKPGQFVLNPDKGKMNKKSIQQAKKAEIEDDINISISTNNVLSAEELRKKEQKEQKNIQKDMTKQRKKQLVEANKAEDLTIKRLEKQLKLNKRKTKAIPKSFVVDGLDYLLEVCDSEAMKGAVSAEAELNVVNDEFEEDFALMTCSAPKVKEKILKKDAIKHEGEFEDHDSDISDTEDNHSLKKRNPNKINQCVKLEDDLDHLEDLIDEDDESDTSVNDEEDDLEDVEEFIPNKKLSKKQAKKKKLPEFEGDLEFKLLNEDDESDGESRNKGTKNKDKQSTKVKNEMKEDKSKVISSSTNRAYKRRENEDQKNSKNKKAKVEVDSDVEDEEFTNDSEVNQVIQSDSENSDDVYENAEKENADGTWEDIYGRLRTKDGAVVNETGGKYIPPGVRARLEANSSDDKKRVEKLNRLKRQIKGLINRLAESNMHSIATQIEELYMNNSRNDMNDTLTSLMMESLVSNVITPERLLMEHVMLIAILHANVGTEVGAHFLQTTVKKFDEYMKANHEVENKMLDNVVAVIAQMYNFKLFDCKLIYEILHKLSENFEEKDVECILLILRSVGFTLRKDDPLALKNLILDLQKRAGSASETNKDNSRVKFMLDILLAIKNNNVTKIPNYDTTYSEHLKKIIKGFIRKGNYITQLNISLEDLLKAEERGRWWVVGSAWTGTTEKNIENNTQSISSESFSQKLLELARKQRMNTDTRRNIFCIIMSAEDYLDAFEKLLHLGLKNQQEREIIHVILHCCLQEKQYNPYYSVLAQRFCEYDRKYQMIIKCSIWDKLKALTDHSGSQISNLAKLLSHLFVEKGLPISTLKIVQFSELDKITLRFIRQILLGILLHTDVEACQGVFENVTRSDKLKMFRESLKLFIHHFLLKNIKTDIISEDKRNLLESRAKLIERVLSRKEETVRF